MATSAFAVDSLSKVYRWRPKAGRSAGVVHAPMKASQAYRYGDILGLDTGATNTPVEPIIDPTGSAGATLSGDASVLPKYIALQTVTAGSSVTLDDTIACVDINDVELLMRLYHTTAGSSEQQDAEFLQPYEWGIYEPDASSTGYYPVIDIANQDGVNGAFQIVEFSSESDPADDYGLVWVETTGLS